MHFENNNDNQPEMQLECQTSEQGNDDVESDRQTDEYDTGSDRELLPVSDHREETVFLLSLEWKSITIWIFLVICQISGQKD